MPTPFPGMDPHLERRGLWGDVHTRLIVTIANALGPKVRPRYRVNVELRTYLTVSVSEEEFVGVPDVLVMPTSPEPAGATLGTSTTGAMLRVAELPMPEKVVERYLEVRDVVSGEAVTVIELLSWTNKVGGERRKYERKRLRVIGSNTNLVEIDLLRAGRPMPFHLSGNDTPSDYRILVSRTEQRPRSDVYLFGVRDPIPDIPIPLRPSEAEPVLPLNELLHELYDQAGYDLSIDYSQPLVPPLQGEDAEWARQVVAHAHSS